MNSNNNNQQLKDNKTYNLQQIDDKQFPLSKQNQIQIQLSSQTSQVDSDDQIQQRPAFYIIEEQKLLQMRRQKQNKLNEQNIQQNQRQQVEDNQQLNDDERQAFLYLHSVRKQKKVLLKQKKIRKAQFKQTQKQTSKVQQNISPQPSPQKLLQKVVDQPSLCIQQKQQFISVYKEQILTNFNIVVQNVRYLIKTDKLYQNNNKRFNIKLYQSLRLQNEPRIYELMRLTIGQIQQGMRKLSLQLRLGTKKKKSLNNSSNINNNQQNKAYKSSQINQQHQPLVINQEQVVNKSANIRKYSLWIYSLLALHQGWSSYKHFQQLAQINYIIINEIQNISKLKQQQYKYLLIIIIIMINIFQQRHLNHYLSQLIIILRKIQDK